MPECKNSFMKCAFSPKPTIVEESKYSRNRKRLCFMDVLFSELNGKVKGFIFSLLPYFKLKINVPNSNRLKKTI